MSRAEMTTSCSSIRPGSWTQPFHAAPGSERLARHAGRTLPDHRDRPGQPLPATDQRGEAAGDPSQVQVKRYRHARINTRACTLLEITYPVHEPKIWGYLARVFVDDEWHFPIRVEVHELPLDRSKGPQLVEEYTYLDLKLNNGYSDADFDPKNPQYKFP